MIILAMTLNLFKERPSKRIGMKVDDYILMLKYLFKNYFQINSLNVHFFFSMDLIIATGNHLYIRGFKIQVSITRKTNPLAFISITVLNCKQSWNEHSLMIANQ